MDKKAGILTLLITGVCAIHTLAAGISFQQQDTTGDRSGLVLT